MTTIRFIHHKDDPHPHVRTYVFDGTTPRQIIESWHSVKIRYPAGFGKGPAWEHLLRFPVHADLDGALYTPDNSPDSDNRPYNPYRKIHTHEFWTWTVTRWKAVPAFRAPKGKGKPPRPRVSRHKMLQDDWLGDTGDVEAITGGDAAPSNDKEGLMTAGVKIYEGLRILLKYQPRSDVAAEHEMIYAGGPKPDQLSDDDRVELTNLGWAYDIQVSSWRKFT